MVTSKDLLDAHRFGRRRLVAAFLSGASAGRAPEPPRYARVVVAGLALAVLVVAGAAIAGILLP